jgi:hypothetical protein
MSYIIAEESLGLLRSAHLIQSINGFLSAQIVPKTGRYLVVM